MLVASILLISASLPGQEEAQESGRPRLKSRTEVAGQQSQQPSEQSNGLWIVPAGTKIPVQLRQAVSTKNAQPGDPIYAQTTFPIAINGAIVIPAGTYAKGVVDTAKRAGRIKGSAELQFHLTDLIYANGYALNLAAAIDQVPGSADSNMKEPGTVKHDSEKGKDIKRIGEAAATGGQIGGIAGATSGSLRGFGIGGLSGIAAGSLIALMARGSDVRFEIGSSVEVSLNHAIAIDVEKVQHAGLIPVSNTPAPIISAPIITIEK
jgi:type IV secretion system protein VirB10